MKEKFLNVLRRTGLDVLLLGLIEKLARNLVKKLTGIHQWASDALARRITDTRPSA